MKNRKYIKRNFEEDEVWYLLWTLANSAAILNANMVNKIGDVRPHNILFNEIGEIKIINQVSWPFELTNTKKSAVELIFTYLAPEEVTDVRDEQKLYSLNGSLC
jgi:hypothetical protein